MHTYDQDFYDYIDTGSLSSAGVVIPLLLNWLPVNSVLDVGCGRGAWLKQWRANGVTDVMGLDGAYVDQSQLLIPADQFKGVDISQEFELGRTFELVQSLEVAEHLPAECAEIFVENLCRHGQKVLFSAAVSGQGGEYHVNEQPYVYWQEKFAVQDFLMLDPLRPLLVDNPKVELWYRYNTFLYVHQSVVESLPVVIRSTQIPADNAPKDISPLPYKLRKQLLKCLPVRAKTYLATLKKKAIVRARQRARHA